MRKQTTLVTSNPGFSSSLHYSFPPGFHPAAPSPLIGWSHPHFLLGLGLASVYTIGDEEQGDMSHVGYAGWTQVGRGASGGRRGEGTNG